MWSPYRGLRVLHAIGHSKFPSRHSASLAGGSSGRACEKSETTCLRWIIMPLLRIARQRGDTDVFRSVGPYATLVGPGMSRGLSACHAPTRHQPKASWYDGAPEAHPLSRTCSSRRSRRTAALESSLSRVANTSVTCVRSVSSRN